MFSISKTIQPGIVLSLFIKFFQISGLRSFKIVLIKKSENTVRLLAFAIGLVFNIYSYAAFKTLLNLKSAQ